jgi:hypothetical protein
VALRELVARLPAAPVALVFLVAGTGLARVATANWREGAALLAGSLLVAAALRLVLPVERLGVLAIRSRAVDVLCYLGFGVVVLALALTITGTPLTFD